MTTVAAWSILACGVVATALVLLGRLVGDANGLLYLTNLTMIYWLAPVVGLFAFAVASRWWVPALACAAGVAVWLATFGPLFVPPLPGGSADLRAVTFNMSPTANVDHVVRLVERTEPDILLLQEVLPDARAELIDELGASLPHHHLPAAAESAPIGGTAVFSRVPITDTVGVDGLEDVSRTIDIVTLATGEGPLHVVSLHLTAPCRKCLSSEVDRVSENRAALARLRRESQTRAREIDRLVAALPDGPILVGGDLNSGTRNAPRLRLLDAGLTDLYRVAGFGPGFTRYRGPWGFRIDWLFGGAGVTAVRTWVEQADVSDHLPVVADLVLPERR